MRNLNFITRHAPTISQITLAEKAGFTLVAVGDQDAFNPDFSGLGDAIACVHPAMAMSFLNGKDARTVCVFENANRAPEGAKPTFEAVRLHVYDITVDMYGLMSVKTKIVE